MVVEEMAAGQVCGLCAGGYFHMEPDILQDMENKRSSAEKRANQRVRKVRERRETIRDLQKGGTCGLPELRVVLLGWVAAGKCSTGNNILGREEFGAWRRTAQCEKKQGKVNGRLVTVVNTPSWWKSIPAELTPDWVRQEVVNSLTLCHPGPNMILLVIPADTSFKEEQRKIIQDNMEHLGERVWGHTLVLFTWGESLGNNSIEQHIESEGQALQWLIQKCGNRYHVLRNMTKDSTQVPELLEKIEEMVAGRSVYHLMPETQSEVVETIVEMSRETRAGDLSTEEKKALAQRIDELWIRREEQLLEKLGLNFPKGTDSGIETWQQGTGGQPPAHFQKLFEKEWNRCESSLTSRSKRTSKRMSGGEDKDGTIGLTGGRATESSTIQKQTTQQKTKHQTDEPPDCADERKARWDSAGVEEMDQKHSDEESHTAPWKTEKAWAFLHNEIKGIFETEWSRKEDTIKDIIRTEIKSYITPPAKETSMSCGIDFGGEPDTPDVAVSCMKRSSPVVSVESADLPQPGPNVNTDPQRQKEELGFGVSADGSLFPVTSFARGVIMNERCAL
ncbi:hypothetical protein COCON_G00113460 [Conger conger]|uniref:AIG1-type G domain-containing protein n=1 Tax=Conger conger TaxID=82655 RepID=A0A9Q1DFB7_CONCO|nr:hypothetical protein COCON_G00113460 [Conger conger]